MISLFIAVLILCGPRALGQQTDAPRRESHPLWKINLRELGHKPFPRSSVKWMRVVVDFTDDSRVVIGWISPDQRSENKAAAFGVPAHLHVVILDTTTGRQLNQKDWSTPRSQSPVLFGIPDNQVVVCTGNSLRLLSQDLDVVKERELPNGASCQRLSYRLSPSKRILLTSSVDEKGTSWELQNVNTFATISTWTKELGKGPMVERPIAVSDDWLLGWCGQPRARSLCLRGADEEWQPFPAGSLNSPASFVGDELLAVGLRDGSKASVVSVQGNVLFQINLPEKHYLSGIAPSARSERFAAIESRLRGLRSEPLDMYPFGSNEQVLVYDLKGARAILAIKLEGTSPWAPWRTHDNSLALSPNGTFLAMLSDEVLSIYSVP